MTKLAPWGLAHNISEFVGKTINADQEQNQHEEASYIRSKDQHHSDSSICNRQPTKTFRTKNEDGSSTRKSLLRTSSTSNLGSKRSSEVRHNGINNGNKQALSHGSIFIEYDSIIR